jgi:hypothetical protein
LPPLVGVPCGLVPPIGSVAAPSKIGSGKVAGGVAVGTEPGRPTDCALGLRLSDPPPPMTPQAETSRASVEVRMMVAAALKGAPAAGNKRILINLALC